MAVLPTFTAERELGDIPISFAARGPSGFAIEEAGGRWPSGAAVTEADRFYGASLTKQITGAAVALLVRDGELDPDAGIPGDVLPLWPIRPTARQLLHHIGGLPDTEVYQRALGKEPWTDAYAVDQLRKIAPPEVPPGSTFVYSNLGYIALARTVEALGRTPFHEFVSRRVFAPLGLSGMAIGQNETALAFPQVEMLGPSLPLSTGDGGLWTTASAFAQWLDAQNSDALNIATLVEQDYVLPTGDPVRYGWGIGLREFRGHALYIHGGTWTGAWAKAARCPALGLSVVALAADRRDQQLSELADAVLEALAEGRLQEEQA